MKLEIWVEEKDAEAWMRDRNKNLIYQMNFSYKKSMHFVRRMVLDFHPDVPEGVLERGKIALVKEESDEK